ncbi:MAG: hypothetical protein R3C19_24695 [Planctomycetaceae bacterium]
MMPRSVINLVLLIGLAYALVVLGAAASTWRLPDDERGTRRSSRLPIRTVCMPENWELTAGFAIPRPNGVGMQGFLRPTSA